MHQKTSNNKQATNKKKTFAKHISDKSPEYIMNSYKSIIKTGK